MIFVNYWIISVLKLYLDLELPIYLNISSADRWTFNANGCGDFTPRETAGQTIDVKLQTHNLMSRLKRNSFAPLLTWCGSTTDAPCTYCRSLRSGKTSSNQANLKPVVLANRIWSEPWHWPHRNQEFRSAQPLRGWACYAQLFEIEIQTSYIDRAV